MKSSGIGGNQSGARSIDLEEIDVAKPTCLKCSATATIAMMCGRCYRNQQPDVETKLPVAGRPVSKDETKLPDLRVCDNPACDETIPQLSTGRPKRFCSPACRLQAHRKG